MGPLNFSDSCPSNKGINDKLETLENPSFEICDELENDDYIMTFMNLHSKKNIEENKSKGGELYHPNANVVKSNLAENMAKQLLPDYRYGETQVQSAFTKIQSLYISSPHEDIYIDNLELYCCLIILDKLVYFEIINDYKSAYCILSTCLLDQDFVVMMSAYYMKYLGILNNHYRLNAENVLNFDGRQGLHFGEDSGKSNYEAQMDTSIAPFDYHEDRKRKREDFHLTPVSPSVKKLKANPPSHGSYVVPLEECVGTYEQAPGTPISQPLNRAWSQYSPFLRIMCSEEFLQRVHCISILRKHFSIDLVCRTLAFPISLLIDCQTALIIIEDASLLNSIDSVKQFVMEIALLSLSCPNIWCIVQCSSKTNYF
jgi:hypothetical protein